MSLLRDHYITVCKSNRRDRRGSWKRMMCGQSSQRILNASTESLTLQIVMTIKTMERQVACWRVSLRWKLI